MSDKDENERRSGKWGELKRCIYVVEQLVRHVIYSMTHLYSPDSAELHEPLHQHCVFYMCFILSKSRNRNLVSKKCTESTIHLITSWKLFSQQVQHLRVSPCFCRENSLSLAALLFKFNFKVFVIAWVVTTEWGKGWTYSWDVLQNSLTTNRLQGSDPNHYESFQFCRDLWLSLKIIFNLDFVWGKWSAWGLKQ